MSIKVRLWVLVAMFLVALASAAVINLISSSKQQVLMHEIADALVASQSLGEVGRLLESNQANLLSALQYDPALADTLAATHYFPASLYFDQVSANAKLIDENWEVYLKTTTASALKGETELFQMVRGEYINVGLMGLVKLMEAGNYKDAYIHFQQQTEPLLLNARPVVALISDKVKERVHNLQMQAEHITRVMTWVLQALVGFAILFGALVAVYTVRTIMANLNAGRAWANRLVSMGELGHKIALKHKDEISEMLLDIQNAFAQIDHSMIQARQVVGAIANADFNTRMTGSYVGDLAELQQGINASADSVSFMMAELEKIMQSLQAGRFNVKMDSRVPEAFRNSVEAALQSMDAVISDIGRVMAEMNKGNFDARVRVPAQGDLLAMKAAINSSMQNTAHIIQAVIAVVEAQSQGDLTQNLPEGVYVGRFDDLEKAMTYSARKVADAVSQAITVSNSVNTAASQVSQSALNLSARMQEQASALEETSATMSEMAHAVQTNTENAHKVAELSEQVKEQSVNGMLVMQQTITAIQSIRESSIKISEIVSIIDGIAFQTNLLALNAAVEAARAAEHGRGFAVVASEVRALAAKSADAARDIKQLIDDSVNRIQVGTKLTEESGAVLNDITASISEVTARIHDIADASHEQSVDIGQVNLAIVKLDQVTQENRQLVEETSSAATCLQQEADSLHEGMSFFRTEQGDNEALNPLGLALPKSAGEQH